MRGTTTSERAEFEPRAVEARVTRAGGLPLLVVKLQDGRVLGLPLWLYPTLLAASPSQQRRIELIAAGRGLRWPDLDLDLSVRGMLAGRPDGTRAARSIARALRLRNYTRALNSVLLLTRRAG